MKSPFEFVNNINSSKKDIMNSDTEKYYNPFLINRAYSYFPDSIFYAREMNNAQNLPLRLQYDFYRFGLSKRKRFSKWIKKKPSEIILAICDYYKYSIIRAEEIENLLSDEFKDYIHDIYKYKNK